MTYAWAPALPLHLLGPSVPQAPVIGQDTLGCIMFPVCLWGSHGQEYPSSSWLLVENTKSLFQASDVISSSVLPS